MNEFETLMNQPINPRVGCKKNSEDYSSQKKLKNREKNRISRTKKYREIQTEYLQTKKKHL